VPISEDICKHIDYNTNILSQFKKMDLQTAIEQRNNNLKVIESMNEKLAYAESVLTKLPTNPTTEYEYNLKNRIIRDLEAFNKVKVRSEARTVLLNSRIQFIEIQVNNNNNN